MDSIVLVMDDAKLADRAGAILSGSGLPAGTRITVGDAVAEPPPGDVVVLSCLLHPRTESPLPAVRQRYPETPLVTCIERTDARSVRWAVNNGADGVVWFSDLESALAPTVQAVYAGQLVVPRENRSHVQPPDLTTREKQVLSLVVMGLSNGEIGQKLYLTEATVKSHLTGAFRKLGVRSRAEAARLVSDPDRGFGTGILAITRPPFSGAPAAND
jgi:DNA-binding NarL/FixJ family response regulator